MLRLRKSAPSDPLIVSMAGLRLGDAVLFVGCSDVRSIAQLATKPGLTGRAAAIDSDAAKVSAAMSAAESEGALLEGETTSFTSLPFAADTFDVVIAIRIYGRLGETERRAAFEQAFRVLRRGGRCLVVEGSASRSFAALFTAPATPPAGAIESVLASAGFRGVRTLAQRERLLFLEGARPK